MAKRARGTVRPGQRRPIERRSVAPSAGAGPAAAAAPRPGGLTEAETRRAAELEAQFLAEERAAEAARRRVQGRSVTREVGVAASRAIRPEEEYAYVARDVKDIIRIASILLVVLVAIWIAVDVAKVVSIG